MKELVAAVGTPLLEQQPKRACRLSPRVVWVLLARWDSILGPGWSPLAPPTSSAGIPEGKRSSRRTRGKAPASPPVGPFRVPPCPACNTRAFRCRDWGDGGGGSLISPRDVTMSCCGEITYTCGVSGDTEGSPAASGTCECCYRPRAHGGMFREISHTRRMCLSLQRDGRTGHTES